MEKDPAASLMMEPSLPQEQKMEHSKSGTSMGLRYSIFLSAAFRNYVAVVTFEATLVPWENIKIFTSCVNDKIYDIIYPFIHCRYTMPKNTLQASPEWRFLQMTLS